MKIADLDTETRKIIVLAHMISQRHSEDKPLDDVLDRLITACNAFDAKHAEERAQNLVRALCGVEATL